MCFAKAVLNCVNELTALLFCMDGPGQVRIMVKGTRYTGPPSLLQILTLHNALTGKEF